MSRRINKQCPQPECAKKMFNEREIFSHYKIEHMLTQLVCAECFSGFDLLDNLSNHFVELHPLLSELRYIDAHVKGDGYNYRGYEILERKRTFAEQKPMPINERLKCCLCNDTFKTITMLQSHCITSHDGKFVTCSRCQTPFKSIFCLNEHSGYCLQTNTVSHMGQLDVLSLLEVNFQFFLRRKHRNWRAPLSMATSVRSAMGFSGIMKRHCNTTRNAI